MDLVQRLRAFSGHADTTGVWIPGYQNPEAALAREAADEIERLRIQLRNLPGTDSRKATDLYGGTGESGSEQGKQGARPMTGLAR